MDAPIFRFDRYSQPSPHILSVGPRVALAITRGRVVQRLRPVLGRVFLIGTANDCDLVLGDLTFPEAYAYLFVQGTKVTIRWLGTGPELVVCGERVETAELLDGDRVAFGPFELRVSIDNQALVRSGRSQALAGAAPESIADQDAEAPCEASLLLADIRQSLAEDRTSLDWMDDHEQS
jgi:type III secretion system (T3SS) inner membrane Yop/YscD-like protein